jgi:hypothetical protein
MAIASHSTQEEMKLEVNWTYLKPVKQAFIMVCLKYKSLRVQILGSIKIVS